MSRRAISRESKRRAARKTAEDKSEHQSEDDAPEFPVQTADDSLASLRKAIHSSGAIEENDTLTERSQPAIEPVFGDTATLSKLHPDLMTALRDSGITQLYRHQAEAVEAALGGNNVVLQSPPASGKTLAFQLPMLDTMLRDPEARALMIYPTKALARDQEEQLKALIDHIPGQPISFASYDGDTDKGATRKQIKSAPPNVLRTNPDMLHYSFLSWAEQWRELYENLRWVIVDEIHEYRGYFGTNVALVLRRLSHHLQQIYGSSPQFFLCSATAANPKEHAEALTGLNFVEVDGADALRPSRHYWSAQLDIPDAGYWDQMRARTVDAGLACLRQGKSVLVFCPTRQFTEECHRAAMTILEEWREQGTADIPDSTVRVFRGGLSYEMRHEIQDGMQADEIKLVFATNALELGINIGGLDGVIMAGFPDNMMSARQQIGRAGRRWNADAFVLYFPRNNPLDQYYAANIDEFLNRPLDDLVINPNNAVVIEHHLPCVLHETPDFDDGHDVLGPVLYREARQHQSNFRRRHDNRPHRRVNIRGSHGTIFNLLYKGREIGQMSADQRFREAYDNAIYLHGGEAYRVDSVTLKRNKPGVIALEDVGSPHLRTRAKRGASLSNEEIYQGRRWTTDHGAVDAFYGQVTVTERIYSVEEFNESTLAVIDSWTPSDNAYFSWDGESCWIEFGEEFGGGSLATRAVEQMLRVGALFTILADEHDVVSQAKANGRDRGVYVAESYEGGIGIATQVLERWRDVLARGVDIAHQCKCDDGCPNCIVPPRMRETLDKKSGIALANAILSAVGESHWDHECETSGIWKKTPPRREQAKLSFQRQHVEWDEDDPLPLE